MDVERGYLRFQDFGMALGMTIVALFLGMLFRGLCREGIDANFLNWGMSFAWSFCVYLNFAAMRTQKLDKYDKARSLRNRFLFGTIVFLAQVVLGVVWLRT